MNYQDINAKTIDKWVTDGWEWGKPVSHEICSKARQGDWAVCLTPIKPVPREWLGEIKQKKILGLACGGGQQMPVFAVLGADCTVLDYSEKQLESERLVAEREGYDIDIVRHDMTKPLPFADESFDLIFHPVSNCYVRDVCPIWKECFRVLKQGGVLLSGQDNGINFIVSDEDETHIVNPLPFNPMNNSEQKEQMLKEENGIQFSHTLEEQLGGQLAAGLIITDLYEDLNESGRLKELNVPTYWATRAVKGKIVF
ncbi:MAG: class I SAM-dependent methyltransferase [Alphaproteobacteria bacterium]|nr:class I SAM-dependent methyltransferase [Alphaproteobacteria bacterium]